MTNLYFFNNIPDLPWIMIKNHVTGFGGVLYFLGAELEISHCDFRFNINLNGGVLAVGSNDFHDEIKINIIQSNFSENEGHNFGGCVYFHKDIVKMTANMKNLVVNTNFANFSNFLINFILYSFICVLIPLILNKHSRWWLHVHFLRL